MKKKIFSRKLLLSAIAFLLATVAFATDYTDVSQGITYTLNTDLTATVSGKTSSYSANITIPSTITVDNVTYNVTAIADKVFYFSSKGTKLKSVKIEEGITSIGEQAFYNCTGLTSVYLPSSIKTIGNQAFKGCTAITSVYIADIASYCAIEPLGSSSGLGAQYTTFPLNANATSGSNKNGKNKYLYVKNESGDYVKTTELVIPEGVTSISTLAFYYYTNLTKVTFPKSLKSIGLNAFYQCTGLKTIQISDLKAWCELNPNSRIGTSGRTLLDENGDEITELTIPDGVETIGEYSFKLCTSITKLTIPGEVETIAVNAFQGCSNLESVYFLGDNGPAIDGSSTLSTTFPSTSKLYYPKGKEGYTIYTEKGNATACEYVDVKSGKQWATGCFSADAVVPDGTTAYYVSAKSDNSVTLTELPETDGQTIVPAKEGFVFNSEEGRHLFIPYTNTTTTLSGNHLTGIPFGDNAATVEAKSVYVLNSTTDGNPIFRLYSGTEIKANHAYLSGDQAGAKADVLSFCFGEPTAITQTETTLQSIAAPIYNMQGQRILTPQRGNIYIQNGKKFMAQ